jgi:hypothetical protein
LRRKKMKRNLIYGLIAILAIGLAIVGCSNGTTPGGNGPPPVGPGPGTGFDELTPLAPTIVTEPTTGYKAFPKGHYTDPDDKSGLLGNTAFYVTSGGEGFIVEGDEEGTYKVTVVTKPGGFSLISFQDADYVYKTGFYLSLDLPTASVDNPHKPIGMTAFASTGPQETGAQWGTAQRVNITGNNAVEDNTKYLAGQVDFAWEDPDNEYPRRTICLYIYWHTDEEAGVDYEFTIRKILVSDDDDLTPPAYPETPWAPAPIPVPTTGWKDFPSASIVQAQGYAGTATPVPGNGFAAKDGGGYTGTIATNPGGLSRISIPGTTDSAFVKGYYISLELPTSSAGGKLRPVKIVPLATLNGGTSNGWDSEVIISPPSASQYVAGNVDIQWYNEDSKKNYNSLDLDFYWHDQEPEGTYTFTLKKLMITTDEAITLPDPWEDFVDFYTNASPLTTGAITANWDSTKNQCLVNITNNDGELFTGGYYVSITLSDANDVTPEIFMATAYDAADAVKDGYVSQATGVVSGKTVTFFWNGNKWDGTPSATEHKKIELLFQWDPATTGVIGKTITFTVNAAKVGAFVPWGKFVDFYTNANPIVSTVAANWDSTKYQCVLNITNASDELFTGGFYVSVTMSDANDVTPETFMATAYDAANSVQDNWVSQTTGVVSDKTVTFFWDGNLWSGLPSTTEHKKIELLFQWDITAENVNGETFTYTVNAAKVGALVP